MNSKRSHINFDDDWKFRLEESTFEHTDYGLSKGRGASGYAAGSYDDGSWRSIKLPHDWAIELPFHLHTNAFHGHKPVSILSNGVDVRQIGIPVYPVGWYRKTFHVPEADQSKCTWLVFDGIFRDAIVWVNSHYLDRHASGYLPLRLDVTDILIYGGKNTIAVRVDASHTEGWWYEGAGIYRHAWLEQSSPLHVIPDTLFANTARQGSGARLNLTAGVINAQPEAVSLLAEALVTDASGLEVSRSRLPLNLAGWEQTPLALSLSWDGARSWSLDDPHLYRVELQLVMGDESVDAVSTPFGVREIRFDPQDGFFLNGQPVKLRGTCNHQDFAGVGVALPDRLHEYKIQRLKEIGCNAYRCAHHAPAPELLEACDRLGMLVMDEARVLGSGPEQLRQLETLLRRDRNHPSIILWSLGNEENVVQNSPVGKKMAQTMIRTIRKLDPTRPITYAGNNGEHYEGVNELVDVRGWNYFTHLWDSQMDRYHADHPQQPVIGSEECSAFYTRDSSTTDRDQQVVRDIDESISSWGSTSEGWWRFYMERPWLAGGFAWTGFDYHGEPGPFMRGNLSNFGALDLCGFLKSGGRYLQAWWSGEPVLHLVPHWNHAGQEGKPVEVFVYTNCDTVELFLNGQSQGIKDVPVRSHLRWEVNYAPGVLEAVGYSDGKERVRARRETAGPPVKIQLSADRLNLYADGQDVALVQVKLVDGSGRLVPEDDREIDFTLEGAGRLIGVGNGDPNSSEPEQFVPTWEKRVLEGWVIARSNAKEPVAQQKLVFQPFQVDGPLPPEWNDEQNAWYPAWDDRTPQKIPGHKALVWWIETQDTGEFYVLAKTRFDLSVQDLESGWTGLALGRVFSASEVRVNGVKVTDLPDQPGLQYMDAAQFLTPGTNHLEVRSSVVKGTGGLAEGAWLCRKVTPAWRRRTFHGYALALIQSDRMPGSCIIHAASMGMNEDSLEVCWV